LEKVGHGFNPKRQHFLSIVTSTSIFFNRNIGINLAVFFKMRGRGRINNDRGGRGRGARGGRGRVQCQNYTGSANAARKGLCTNLGTNVLDCSHKYTAEQMQTSWENLVQYVGTNYGQDIRNELQNKITDILVEPVHTDDVVTRHGVREVMIRTGQLNTQRARKAQENILQAAVEKGEDMDAAMKLEILQNEIAQGEFAANIEVLVELDESDKTQFGNEWRKYQERYANPIKHQGQAF
jgi:hypothetical protein